MEQYILSEDHTMLSPAVVVATAVLIAVFALGIAYNLLVFVL